jgi:serine protease AprX
MTGSVQVVTSLSPSVRVIVQGVSVKDTVEAVRANGGQVTAEIGIINAVVAQVPQGSLVHLAQTPGVIRVTPDRSVSVAGEQVDVEFSKAIGAQEVWDTGNLGAGVTVAFLDTGIDPTFITLRRPPAGRGNRLLAYYDVMSGQLYEPPRLLRSPRDPNGHGTHVAGIVGNSRYEMKDGEYRGVAPATNLVAVRVLDETGVGTYADVLQGIDWVVQNKDTYGIRVLTQYLDVCPAVCALLGRSVQPGDDGSLASRHRGSRQCRQHWPRTAQHWSAGQHPLHYHRWYLHRQLHAR